MSGMDTSELVAAYVLGELSAADAADTERRMATDEGLRSEIDTLSSMLSKLEGLPGDAWPEPLEAAAPAMEVPALAAAPPAPRAARRGLLDRLGFGLGGGESRRPLATALACIALVGIGIAAGAAIWAGDDGETSGGDPVIGLSSEGLSEPGNSATVSMPSEGVMNLDVAHLPPSRDGEYYELWLLSPDGSRQVAVASFRVPEDGMANVLVPLPADPAGFEVFDVSREKVGGDPGHSQISVLRGPTSA